MNYLRQSTASQSRTLGPFVDDVDFKTAETALTIANTDVKLMANGGASANKNSGGGTHRVNGHYSFTFDATDTATVGELTVSIVVSGALPVFKTFSVLEPIVYDALFADAAGGYLTAADGATIAGYIDTEIGAIKTVTDQLVAAQAELSAVPAANATPLQKLAWMFILSRNKLTQTASTQVVRNDADSANIASAAVSDDGTTFTRGEYS